MAHAARADIRAVRGSFKVKLALYFLLLAVLPLTAAFWGFGAVTSHAEEQRVDARVSAELRAILSSYHRRLRSVHDLARGVAGRPDVQRALANGTAVALPAGVRRVGAHRIEVGAAATLTASTAVRVREGKRVLGYVVGSLPLDRTLLRALRSDSALSNGDRLVFFPSARQRVPARKAFSVSVAGTRYRAAATGALTEQPDVQLAVLAPADSIAAEAAHTQRRLLYVLLAGLLVLGVIATAEARSLMRSVGELANAAQAIGAGDLDRRVPVRGRDEFAALARSFNSMAAQLRSRLEEIARQRGRLRDSLSRFGELLAATHDTSQLLLVIAATAAEAANADGALVLSEDGDVVEVGELADDAERLELSIASGGARFGLLVLYGHDFDEDDLVATRSLVTQAAVALENVRLHEAAERLAIADGLTGLYNRRHCEERLVAEVARSDRYDTPLALILCDVDGFKLANDVHGHGFGDEVLERFARVLSDALRPSDISGRWGGEEFLVVLPETPVDGAVEVAERIRSTFAATEFDAGDGQSVSITASFGVAGLRPRMTSRDLVREADEALYAAKRLGKNRVEVAAEAAAPAAST
jgi:diguanylate cyclase (GGDEF)-like protein